MRISGDDATDVYEAVPILHEDAAQKAQVLFGESAGRSGFCLTLPKDFTDVESAELIIDRPGSDTAGDAERFGE